MKKIGFLVLVITSLVLVSIAMAVTTDTAATSATVTVNEFLSVTLTGAPVTFPGMDPGTGPTAADVGNGYPLTATIGSESNVNANVGTKADATDFVETTNASLTFPVSNMEWDDATIGPWTNYTTSDATVCSSVSPGSACDIYHQLTVPGGQAAGTYSVGITVTATSV